MQDLARLVADKWPDIRSDDAHTLEEAKIGVIRRLGETLRTLNEAGTARYVGYKQLYDICCREYSYTVRLAGAYEIGLGGCAAFEELRDKLARPMTFSTASLRQRQAHPDGHQPARPSRTWETQVSAWILPLLVSSVDPDCDHDLQRDLREGLRGELQRFLDAMSAPHPDGNQPGSLSISEEIALAQGFKYAANRRHGRFYSRPDAWSYLEDQALEMLKRSRYWYSDVNLIQALTLWALDGSREQPAAAAGMAEPSTPRPNQDPDRIVGRWLDIIANRPLYRGSLPPIPGKARPLHQFVEAAADMATRALAVRQPGRFIWISDSGAVARVGAGQPDPAVTAARTQTEWIPSSSGWSALDPEAQQLLADVLVVLNLAERGEQPDEAEARLELLTGTELPPCITKDRRPLEPLLTAANAESHKPGSSCLAGCQFGLCPYPPKGLQHYRAELSEEFCRRQFRLGRRHLKLRRTARWQGMWAKNLRNSWAEMASRSQNGRRTANSR